MKIRSLWLGWIVMIATSSALAQQPMTATETSQPAQSLTGVQLKGKAPVNTKTLTPTLPKPIEDRLANGLQIVLIEDHELPTFTLQLVIDRGSVAESKGKEGLAQATAAQLREGTKTRSTEQISEALDSLGASFGARSDLGTTAASASGLVESLDAVLGIFADVLRNPTFPQSELDKYKQRLMSQIQNQRGSSGFVAQEQFARALYGDFPAGTLVPPEASIHALTSADLTEYHAQNYAPNVAMLLVAGDLTMAQLKPKLERALGDWARKDVTATTFGPVATPPAGRVFVIDRPSSVQTSLVMGNLATKGDDPDRFAINVMNRILGGSPASRLFTNLREDKGYTYGAYSSVSSNRYPGVAGASAEVRTEVTEGAMKEFMYEFERIAKEPVSDVELANAKRAIIGGFALSLENPQAFLGNVYQQKLYGFSPNYWEQYPRQIEAVTKSDVARVAAKYFNPKSMQIVAVGDAPKIREAMSKYGTVQPTQPSAP
jgi:predicted Zn-dependent peptidase